MMTEKLTKEIDAVAEELITADLNNLQDLGRLYTCFQDFLRIAADRGCDMAVKPASAAIELIKDAILDESTDRKKLLNILNATVSCFQQANRYGNSPVNIQFPRELALMLANDCDEITHHTMTLNWELDACKNAKTCA